MNEIMPFSYKGSPIRTVVIDGELWWVARDVCEALGISNHRDAVARLNPAMRDDVGITDAIGREQQTTVVSEAGLYRLAFTSRKEKAEKFTDWVASEVIPSIRKHGAYLAKPMSVEDMIIAQAQSVKELRSRVDSLQQTVEFQDRRLEDVRRGLVDVNAPLRHQFNKAVRDLAKRAGWTYDRSYDYIYDTLGAQEHIDIRRRAENRGVRPIDILQESDLLVKAIRLAKALSKGAVA